MRGSWLVAAALLVGCSGEAGPAGPAGAHGDPGPAGPAGPKGDPGGGSSADPSKITRSIFCTGQLPSTPVFVDYNAVLFASGNVFATTRVYDASLSATGTSFYAPSQMGADVAAVFASIDVAGSATGGYFRVTLDRSSLVTTVVYTDQDVTEGSDTWTMTADKCVSNTY